MYKVKITPRTFHFQHPAGTSRGIYTERKSWMLEMTDDNLPGQKGIGECAPLPDLSCDDLPDYDDDDDDDGYNDDHEYQYDGEPECEVGEDDCSTVTTDLIFPALYLTKAICIRFVFC